MENYNTRENLKFIVKSIFVIVLIFLFLLILLLGILKLLLRPEYFHTENVDEYLKLKYTDAQESFDWFFADFFPENCSKYKVCEYEYTYYHSVFEESNIRLRVLLNFDESGYFSELIRLTKNLGIIKMFNDEKIVTIDWESIKNIGRKIDDHISDGMCYPIKYAFLDTFHRTIEYNAYYLSDSYLGHNDEQFSSEELQDIYSNLGDEIRNP